MIVDISIFIYESAIRLKTNIYINAVIFLKEELCFGK
jgi:hypothetical protein